MQTDKGLALESRGYRHFKCSFMYAGAARDNNLTFPEAFDMCSGISLSFCRDFLIQSTTNRREIVHSPHFTNSKTVGLMVKLVKYRIRIREPRKCYSRIQIPNHNLISLLVGISKDSNVFTLWGSYKQGLLPSL